MIKWIKWISRFLFFSFVHTQSEELRQKSLERFMKLDRVAGGSSVGRLVLKTDRLPVETVLQENSFQTPQQAQQVLVSEIAHITPPFSSSIKETFNISKIRSGIPLTHIQCELNAQGASNLVVELIIKNPNQTIFLKSVELGIALLEGGNTVIQKTIFSKLKNENHSERFFSVFFQKMKQAEAEIKNLVTVNTSDLIKNSRNAGGEDGSGNVTPRYRNSFMMRSNSFSSLNGQTVLSSEELQQAYQTKLCPTNISNRLKSTILNTPSPNPFLLAPPHSFLNSSDEPGSSFGSGVGGGAGVGGFGKFNYPINSVGGFTGVYSRYGDSSGQSSKLPEEIAIMKPILRFLQLLCENHNRELQNYLRNQNNKNNYNLISETLIFLDCICGSTTGALGLLGLYINESNVNLVNQTLETLTEYCQGPCHENQNCIAMHESNGIDNIIALILNDINPLGRDRMDLVLELKNNASKLLLAIMESRADSENAERILISMSPRQLIEVASIAYHQKTEDADFDSSSILDDDDQEADDGQLMSNKVCAKEVGHNIYILCHQLAVHNKELATYLKLNNLGGIGSNQQSQQLAPSSSSSHHQLSLHPAQAIKPLDEQEQKLKESLSFYAKHTAQIEIVRSDRIMERIVFPVPPICEYLTKESKHRLFYSTERDEQGSKVSDFFNSTEELFNEMKWQKKLRQQPSLYWISRQMSTWSSISFGLAMLVNLIVAFLYPFDVLTHPLITQGGPLWLLIFWVAPIISCAMLFTFLKIIAIRVLIMISIFRLIPIVGVGPVLLLLGIGNMIVAGVHMLSILGNQGIFTKRFDQILTDFHFLYHSCYLMFCASGLFVHPFFYSILLFNMIYQEETLKNVIRSVTRNGRSILLTALLALILIYSFSIVGYLFFRDDFLMETEPPVHLASGHMSSSSSPSASNNTSSDESSEVKERACDSLIMCIITTLNQGLRNGGGIGDVLRSPSSTEPLFIFRVIYDLLFYFILIVITLNLIFGVIIDTFADLRSEKQQKDEIIRNTCFICGLERSAFDNRPVSFEEHICTEHNLWHYLYFIVLIKVKNRTEFTGPESYVWEMIEHRNLDWFPRMRAMSLLSAEETDSAEQNELRILSEKLDLTSRLVSTLSQQLQELKEQVRKREQQVPFLFHHFHESFLIDFR